MDQIYILFVILLFILAISDLVVGVCNDAVNFLNSAIGSKAAPFYVIMIVAILGIMAGTTFSSGMMEIARSGIFHPDQFHFREIMIIFVAVMITDILLLDTFSSFGLPTSTTVSIIFELLGAAVAVALVKIFATIDNPQDIGTYINSSKALGIISGILLSVVIAFTVGAIVQFISRLLFTFNFKPKLKYLGGVWAGFAITAITYFMVIKGARGASFISPDIVKYIESNAYWILMVSMAIWTILFQFLIWAFRTDVLRITVLIGTFALAMAFAGNDLVNFIGVPLAGFESFRIFSADPASDPNQFLMGALTKPIFTPTYLLLLAGVVMSVTLIFSRKARTVIDTEVGLARQDEGVERFGSTSLSRNIVRLVINFGNSITKTIPAQIGKIIEHRMDQRASLNSRQRALAKGVSFDMLRASVNLVVASILIAMGTSLKLPLSTTYVTFMVAMGTSFADGAWGRESAVYRVTGVLSVIGGWFVTAIIAFTVSLIIAFIMVKGGMGTTLFLIAVALFVLIRQQRAYKRRQSKLEETKQEEIAEVVDDLNILDRCTKNIISNLSDSARLYSRVIQGLFEEDRKKLKLVHGDVTELNKHTKKLKDNIHKTVDKLREDSIETGHYYVQVLDYLREIAHCLNYISEPCLVHVSNNHKGLLLAQKHEISKVQQETLQLLTLIQRIIQRQEFLKQDDIFRAQTSVLDNIDRARKAQIKRIKSNEAGTKNSVLYLNVLAETKNLILFSVNLFKSQRDFVLYTKGDDTEATETIPQVPTQPTS
ncbi:MAG: inorganic phosphate transporter [Bacteroidales bacterium]|nr:inorganic phosphate transporter [Bacteroidales bacterium]MDZ4204908.1 inorganic phosphate transporter [Bacteroidales bacterium]